MSTIQDIMIACVILHNMIIEDESEMGLEQILDLRQGVRVHRGLTFQQFQREI